MLVYFDDYIAFAEPDDGDEMERLLRETRSSWKNRFVQLFIVGASGRRIWEGPRGAIFDAPY